MIRLFQFVILTLGLALVALASAIVTMRFAIHGAEVKVPSFQGMTAAQAQAKAADLGVELSVDNRFYSAEVPAGRILAQSPPPGAIVRREWHVRTTESLGPQLVAIPDLVGRPLRDSTMQIRRLGLELGAVAHMPSAAPPDTVLAQDPPAGGAGVDQPGISLVVSDASPPPIAAFVMPDLVGQQYATAVATITRAGLKLSPNPNYAPGLATPVATAALPGTVIAQTPLAGYSVDPTTPVQLTILR